MISCFTPEELEFMPPIGELKRLTDRQRASLVAHQQVTRPDRHTWADVRGPLVYFIESGPGGPIKIGWTGEELFERVRKLQTGNPAKLDVVGCFVSDQRVERHFHRGLRDSRIRGEWYERTAALPRLYRVLDGLPELSLFDARRT
jgi:hypothetical protein